ncbi:hypothetical protein [Flagellimonas algicola]|uniref:Uncharacterized protein n=1 Tax=Flagellimonas algicola TaxID=2583815 RepID=A0ABY2WPU8_9FLAO|nr:hypothetical protein [Allomuricauda algicola]TMU56780.1 hypothetical protein FGG15_04345 [Allomuricauda algicola]
MRKFTLFIIYSCSAVLLICCGYANNRETSENMVVSDSDQSSVEMKLEHEFLTQAQFARWKSIVDDDREL